MIADDVEMYHDRGGFVWRGADGVIADYAKSCAERRRPDARRSRRELVRTSLANRRLAGRARFTQLWTLGADGSWPGSSASRARKRISAGRPTLPPAPPRL